MGLNQIYSLKSARMLRILLNGTLHHSNHSIRPKETSVWYEAMIFGKTSRSSNGLSFPFCNTYLPLGSHWRITNFITIRECRSFLYLYVHCACPCSHWINSNTSQVVKWKRGITSHCRSQLLPPTGSVYFLIWGQHNCVFPPQGVSTWLIVTNWCHCKCHLFRYHMII